MKQNITIDDLNELSNKGRKRLEKWWMKKEKENNRFPWDGKIKYTGDNKKNRTIYIRPLLMIGEMIEFLDENSYESISSYDFNRQDFEDVMSDVCKALKKNSSDDVVFELWQACKEVLEQ